MDPMQGATTLERRLVHKAKTSRLPINGSLELLPLCNMNCDMCYVRLSRTEMEAQGRLRTLDEWLDIAEEMKKAGTLFLLLTGGEPLLYPDFKQLYLKLKEMGFIITINTNGTLIDEGWASFFGKQRPRRINITLYGADDRAYRDLCHYPGGFEKVIDAVKLLKEQGVDVKLSSSLTRANQHDIEQIIVLVENLDIPVRVDTYMMPAVRERNHPYDEQSRLDPVSAARVRIQALKQEMGKELFEEYVRKIVFEVEHILPEEGPGRVHCLGVQWGYAHQQTRPLSARRIQVRQSPEPHPSDGEAIAAHAGCGEDHRARRAHPGPLCRFRQHGAGCRAGGLLRHWHRGHRRLRRPVQGTDRAGTGSGRVTAYCLPIVLDMFSGSIVVWAGCHIRHPARIF